MRENERTIGWPQLDIIAGHMCWQWLSEVPTAPDAVYFSTDFSRTLGAEWRFDLRKS